MTVAVAVFIETKVAVRIRFCHTVPYEQVSPILWYCKFPVGRVVCGSFVGPCNVVDDDTSRCDIGSRV